MGRVVVVGSLNVDVVVHVARHPGPGETVMGSEPQQGFGGKGANQALAAARAGAEVVMVGCVGDDPEGTAYARRLTEAGIDTSHLVVAPGRTTGRALIAVAEDGDNSIIVSPGANGALEPAHLGLLDEMTGDDVALLQLEIPLELVAEVARRVAPTGATLIINLAPYADLPADAIADALVVVNEHEAAELAASGGRAGSLLVTLGSQGSRWGDLEVAAGRVDTVVDTTGAGDTYCGALAAALAAGADRETAMRRASDAAALSVGWPGAQR